MSGLFNEGTEILMRAGREYEKIRGAKTTGRLVRPLSGAELRVGKREENRKKKRIKGIWGGVDRSWCALVVENINATKKTKERRRNNQPQKLEGKGGLKEKNEKILGLVHKCLIGNCSNYRKCY